MRLTKSDIIVGVIYCLFVAVSVAACTYSITLASKYGCVEVKASTYPEHTVVTPQK